jgi:hypothetical protein
MDDEDNDIMDDLLNEEDDDQYFKKLAALNELRKDYGPPSLYPKYEGWKIAIYSSN